MPPFAIDPLSSRPRSASYSALLGSAPPLGGYPSSTARAPAGAGLYAGARGRDPGTIEAASTGGLEVLQELVQHYAERMNVAGLAGGVEEAAARAEVIRAHLPEFAERAADAFAQRGPESPEFLSAVGNYQLERSDLARFDGILDHAGMIDRASAGLGFLGAADGLLAAEQRIRELNAQGNAPEAWRETLGTAFQTTFDGVLALPNRFGMLFNISMGTAGSAAVNQAGRWVADATFDPINRGLWWLNDHVTPLPLRNPRPADMPDPNAPDFGLLEPDFGSSGPDLLPSEFTLDPGGGVWGGWVPLAPGFGLPGDGNLIDPGFDLPGDCGWTDPGYHPGTWFEESGCGASDWSGSTDAWGLGAATPAWCPLEPDLPVDGFEIGGSDWGLDPSALGSVITDAVLY